MMLNQGLFLNPLGLLPLLGVANIETNSLKFKKSSVRYLQVLTSILLLVAVAVELS